MTGPGSIVRTQNPPPGLAVELPCIVPVSEAKAPAVIPKRSRLGSLALRRLVRPFWIAAGLAGAAIGGVGTTAVYLGAAAAVSSSSSKPVATQSEAHLASVRAAYAALDVEAVRTLQKQAHIAATVHTIGFVVELPPLGDTTQRERDRQLQRADSYRLLSSDTVARKLATYGRVYAGVITTNRLGPDTIESASAKEITSIPELQRFLAEVGK